MITSLNHPDIERTLKAEPSQIVTSNGTKIDYPFPSPADWRDHWIYFLLVDRFNNPHQRPFPDEFPCNVYQGGNFEGIKQQLPYLKSLGVGAIWLSPVLMNPQWFTNYWGGYGISDFLRIEPRFCKDPQKAREDPSIADQEFRSLVDEIHAHGMYVILDIVLNHAGDFFIYEGMHDVRPWNNDREYKIFWRDELGIPHEEWDDVSNVPHAPEIGVWPLEFRRNEYFRRRGEGNGDISKGDFNRLRELATDYQIPGSSIHPVRNLFIQVYQYLIARFDLDGYRIDTLQYVEPDFARVFGNAIREYALSIGKKNFFTFGEVWQDCDIKIAEFVGRNTEKEHELIGVDAAIDFPMRKRLVEVCKGFAPPSCLSEHFDIRRNVLKKVVCTHGDAGRHYVTFIDNHDLDERFHQTQFPGQTKLALTCLMTLQGIPCIYYGNEQGLSGSGNRREFTREAMWGRQDAFSFNNEWYLLIQQLSQLRQQEPALRYGRQYFRPCSGNGVNFGYSSYIGGILAFSRVLNNRELLVVANTGDKEKLTVQVIVDNNINPESKVWKVLFPFNWQGAVPPVSITNGHVRSVKLTLEPMEVIILG